MDGVLKPRIPAYILLIAVIVIHGVRKQVRLLM